MRSASSRLSSSRERPKASSRSIGGAPGPSGGGPEMTEACHSASEKLSSAPISPSREPNRRKTVPLPTPARAATASMVRPSMPQLSMRASAATSSASRLRAASRRSGAGSPSSGRRGRSLIGEGHCRSGGPVVQTTPGGASSRNENGPQSVSIMTSSSHSTGAPMSETRVAVLVGSLRADSVNRRLAEVLRDQAPEGVTLDLVDGLGELPFYNEDLDHGTDVPQAAAALRERVAGADRVLAVTP